MNHCCKVNNAATVGKSDAQILTFVNLFLQNQVGNEFLA